MNLEITPSLKHSLIRLRKLVIKVRRASEDYVIYVVTPDIYKEKLINYLKVYDIYINPDEFNVFKKHMIIYFQFDFLPKVQLEPNNPVCGYITSLRYARSTQQINEWLFGKRRDVLLSLIAINKNSLAAFDIKSRRYIRISSQRHFGEGGEGALSKYGWNEQDSSTANGFEQRVQPIHVGDPGIPVSNMQTDSLTATPRKSFGRDSYGM